MVMQRHLWHPAVFVLALLLPVMPNQLGETNCEDLKKQTTIMNTTNDTLTCLSGGEGGFYTNDVCYRHGRACLLIKTIGPSEKPTPSNSWLHQQLYDAGVVYVDSRTQHINKLKCVQVEIGTVFCAKTEVTNSITDVTAHYYICCCREDRCNHPDRINITERCIEDQFCKEPTETPSSTESTEESSSRTQNWVWIVTGVGVTLFILLLILAVVLFLCSRRWLKQQKAKRSTFSQRSEEIPKLPEGYQMASGSLSHSTITSPSSVSNSEQCSASPTPNFEHMSPAPQRSDREQSSSLSPSCNQSQ